MHEKVQKIVTRFAPSPTGLLHIGAYRTAIFSYLFARHHGGTFVLRIEDTDKERSTKENEDNIMESLAWLDLKHDVFVRQSEQLPRHKEVMHKMIADGFAYISKEEAKDGSGVVKEIVRFKNPNIDITFHDEIKGDITMNTTDLGDFVIARSIDEPLFHLAVVVDDFDEGITHVIRGEDHVSNTPRQILIQRAIGAPQPMYAHLPLVLGPDKLKLSKRRGALPVTAYRDLGYLPDAILNGAAMIGWNPGGEQEVFSHDELVSLFDLARVQASPAVFNEEKLAWFNKEHMKKLSASEALQGLFLQAPKDIPGTLIEEIAPLLLERISYFGEVKTLFESGEMDCFVHEPTYAKEILIPKKGSAEITKEHLGALRGMLEPLSVWDKESIKNAVWDYATQRGRGEVLWPMRVALSGREQSPDPFTIAGVVGKEKTLARLLYAQNSLTI